MAKTPGMTKPLTVAQGLNAADVRPSSAPLLTVAKKFEPSKRKARAFGKLRNGTSFTKSKTAALA
ncbi:hypothetical protein [Bradyrhizobium sp. dw_78]|uniref:hypothetical protein n=1 Tax=Bradyrhizobium sp. dw_78 TaxID=2719793 RepID=UPI001BD3BF6E|nr:hypothetical protein [Bradyrhizobium sp. dw_78]